MSDTGKKSFDEILGSTDLEKQEFRLSRIKLRDQLSKMLGEVEDAIRKSDETGEAMGVQDIVYTLGADSLRKAFADVSSPMSQAAQRSAREGN